MNFNQSFTLKKIVLFWCANQKKKKTESWEHGTSKTAGEKRHKIENEWRKIKKNVNSRHWFLAKKKKTEKKTPNASKLHRTRLLSLNLFMQIT